MTNDKTGPGWCVVPGAPKVVNIDGVFLGYLANLVIPTPDGGGIQFRQGQRHRDTEKRAMNNFLRDAVSLW